jgi:hypothetical protein
MQRAAAARTGMPANIELYVLARQMIRKLRAPRRGFGGARARRDYKEARFDPGDIGLDVFEPEGQLIAIDTLRAPPELMALKPLNDETEPLDLGLRLNELGAIAILLRGQLAYQPMQRIDVIRQSVEIEGHASECKTESQKRPRQSPA